jgi:hypothetical protein
MPAYLHGDLRAKVCEQVAYHIGGVGVALAVGAEVAGQRE